MQDKKSQSKLGTMIHSIARRASGKEEVTPNHGDHFHHQSRNRIARNNANARVGWVPDEEIR